MSEESICFLEGQIPELAELAVKQAYWKALLSGYSVLKSQNGFLVEVFPDGTTKIIKKLPPSIPVKIGTRLELR